MRFEDLQMLRQSFSWSDNHTCAGRLYLFEFHAAPVGPDCFGMRSRRSTVPRPVGHGLWRLVGRLGCSCRLQAAWTGVFFVELLRILWAGDWANLDGWCGLHRHGIKTGQLFVFRMGDAQLCPLQGCWSVLHTWAGYVHWHIQPTRVLRLCRRLFGLGNQLLDITTRRSVTSTDTLLQYRLRCVDNIEAHKGSF